MTTSMLIGMTGGTASAVNPPPLCVDQLNVAWCAFDNPGSPYKVGMIQGTGSGSQWIYPAKPFQNYFYDNTLDSGYITEAATTECLQINQSNYYVVRLAQCVNDQAEMWENWYNPTTKRTEFASEYYRDPNTGLQLCLSFDQSGTDVPGGLSDILRADPCTPGGAPYNGTSHWYQQWGNS